MGVLIKAISAVVPENYKDVVELSAKYGETETKRMIKTTGVEKRHIADPHTTALDLGEEACLRIFKEKGYSPDDFQGLIFISQTPDYKLPASACILQDRLGLSKNTIAFDVNLGCSAFPYGLAIASSFINSGLLERIFLVVGDTLSKITHPDDRSTYPLFGDCSIAVVLEKSTQNDILGYDFGTDGSGWKNLVLPIGQLRNSDIDVYKNSSSKKDFEKIKYPESIFMDGNEIFTFTLREVPGIIRRTLENSDKEKDSVDYFLFHQANLFILNHLIKKAKLPIDKCPVSIDDYGNTSGASPALTACARLAEINSEKDLTTMFVGFGVGYSWGGALVLLQKNTILPISTYRGGKINGH
jgi:3-oxoacyl-[acyl-carrier-protein] synthase-3